MEMKKQFGVIVGIFVFVLIGAALAGVIGDVTYEAVNTQTNLNESVDVTLTRSLTIPSDFVNTNLVEADLKDTSVASINEVRWSNGTVLTVTTDYVVTGYSTTGTENITIGLLNTTANIINGEISNNTVVDYTYYPEGYMENSTGRTLLRTFLVLFFVLAILITVIGMIVGKDKLLSFIGI